MKKLPVATFCSAVTSIPPADLTNFSAERRQPGQVNTFFLRFLIESLRRETSASYNKQVTHGEWITSGANEKCTMRAKGEMK